MQHRKTMAIGQGMALAGILQLAVLSQPASADAYRCKGKSGLAVISATPCEEGYVTSSVAQSDSIEARQLRQAQADLERQREFVASRERERGQAPRYVAAEANPHRGTGNVHDPETRDRIHACLMAVTATTGLPPNEEARRKVNCYVGTRQLHEECENRVASTMRLDSSAERHYKAQCGAVSGG